MIIYFLISLFCLYYILLYLQQYHYHYDGFIKILKKGIKEKVNYLLLFTLFGYMIIFSKYYIIIVLLGFIFFIILKLKDKLIVRLKVTKRIIRNIIINIILDVLFLIFLKRFIWLLPLCCLLFAFLSFVILEPIEGMIRRYYLKKAKKKIKRIKPLVIAITGSAGKTSIKHFLYHIIKDKYFTFMTKGSINTALGIARAINCEMSELTEVAIIECGVSHRGDMDKILKVIDVDVSVISTIFPQHLETFKSFDLLVKEKEKLAQYGNFHLGLEGIVNQLYYSKAQEIKEVGKDIVLIKYQMGEYFSFRMDGKYYQWKCKVLGKNNIINVLYVIYLAKYLGLKIKYIERKVNALENVSNRLKIRNQFNKIIIDDSFNSNYSGFCDALDVLKIYDGYKVVITPGIVSGDDIAKYNHDIALKIMNIVDKCYLVESVVSKYIKEEFDNNLFEYHYVSSFNEAYEEVIKDNNIKAVLIENDIPDIYKG